MKKVICYALLFLFLVGTSNAQWKLEVYSYSITRWANGSIKNGNVVFKVTCEKDTTLTISFYNAKEYREFKVSNFLPNRYFYNSYRVRIVNSGIDTLSGEIAYNYSGPIRKSKVKLKKGKVYYMKSDFEFWYETKFVEIKEIIIDHYDFAAIMDKKTFELNKSKRRILVL